MNLKTIAKLAGVSTVTVSNVMNGKYNKASKETIERVQRIIKENNYQPSATARSLIMKESHIIGVVVPYLDENESFSVSPYYTQMLAYLERYIRNQDYYLMFRCVQESIAAVPVFSTWNVDGAILLGVFGEDALQLREKLDIPAVFIDTYTDDVSIANVRVDDYKGGYLAAKYLLDRGHRQIAFVAPTLEFPGVIQERYRGFSEAFREQGIEVGADQHFMTNTLYECGVEVGKQIASSPMHFTAVVAMADIVAFGVMEGLRLSGRRVPDDVSVIGFDDLPECRYSNPPLTTISQHLEEKARCAGEYLFSMLKNKKMITGNKKIGVELIERQSVKVLTDTKGKFETER